MAEAVAELDPALAGGEEPVDFVDDLPAVFRGKGAQGQAGNDGCDRGVRAEALPEQLA